MKHFFTHIKYLLMRKHLTSSLFALMLCLPLFLHATGSLKYVSGSTLMADAEDPLLNVFSKKYGVSWVRMKMYRDASYGAGIDGAGMEAVGITKPCDLSAVGELWCLVGTPSAFKLYNKATGKRYALAVNATAEGTAAAMARASSATIWQLVEKDGGYAVVPAEAPEMSVNAYGGKGSHMKLYNAADQGGWWTFDVVGTATLTLSVEVEGAPWEATPRVAEIDVCVNGISSSSRVTGSVASQIFHLPADAETVSLSSMTYRGYTFVGFQDAQGTLLPSFANLELAGNTSVKALYRSNDWRTLYYTPDAAGAPYRIPAVAAAPNGHIFAISDNRPCGSDIGYGEVDIKCRISKDNGVSWGEEFFVVDGRGGDTNEMTTGYGDAAIVADCEQNKLLVMMVCGRTVCWNGRWSKEKMGDTDAEAVNRVARVYATFNADTDEWEWTQPEEVTDQIYSLFLDGESPTVSSMFIGSGKICQSRVVKKGEYYRLYCSMWTRDGGNRVIYSDDFGCSWSVLGSIHDRPAPAGDEPKCEELPDGTVVLSSRKGAGRYFNLFTFSDDTFTAGEWGTAASSNDVEDGLSFGANSTNGEILLVRAVRKSDGGQCDLMLQSVPAGNGRREVAIFYKEMLYGEHGANNYTPVTFSQGWTKGVQLSDRGSAYSTMTMQKDGRVAFLYEEEPGGYCIVYAPLSLEAITDGAYSVDMED